MWGIACIVVVDQIHPMIVNLVDFIPETASIIILIISTIVLVIDLVATVKTIFKLNKKLEIIEELSAMIRKSSDEFGENLATGVIALSVKKGELEEMAEQKKEEIEEKINKTKKTVELNNVFRKQKLEEALEHREHALLQN